MSVFQRGGNYLHRRLTKLYSDTKQSYETATVASKTTADEDPILKALHREFRLQKDRLLAWGLQWSDTNATPSPEVEIDQKLDQAGLGHVVALVMSDIQKLLIESEKLQHPQPSFQEKISTAQLDSKVGPGRSEWTFDNVAKSRSLLSQLVTCIDSLYKLSESRRTMSTSSKMEKASKESLRKESPGLTSDPDSHAQHLQSISKFVSQFEELVRHNKLYLDSSCISLTLDPSLESETPPPYEEVMPFEQTRLLGMLDSSRLPEDQLSALGLNDEHPKPVIVEYLPTIPHGDNGLDEQYCAALRYAQQLFERQSSPKVSHNGSLRLIGYTIDFSNARHGFVYRLPLNGRLNDLYNKISLSNLRALIPSKRDESDQPSPTLEDRFRLAFNILLSMVHWSMQGLHHENLNSTNIVILSDQRAEQSSHTKPELASFDIRRPYLLHSPPPSETKHHSKALSVNMYRHANDTAVHASGRSLAFDIYSFGLILLEIGLWTPVSRLWKPKYTNSIFTSRIKNIYIPKLASRCGTAYMKVVQSCINAPDLAGIDASIVTPAEKTQFWCSCMIQIGRELSLCCALDLEGPPCEPDLAYFERLNNMQASLASRKIQEKTHSNIDPPRITEQSSADNLVTSPAKLEPEPASALTVQQTILKKWNNIDIPQECLDQWNTYLMPRISKLLQRALDSSRESCSASLMMVGKTPETAKTTICIQCTSVEKVRDCLKRNFRCKNGWGLVVLRGDVRRSGKARRKGQSQDSARSRLCPPQATKSTYQQRPHFGASIGAFRANEHLPPVSFGGAILVDGKPYGMTVHHMLDTPSDDEDEVLEEKTSDVQRSAAKASDAWLSDLRAEQSQQSQNAVLELSDILEISDDESESSTIRPDYIDLETGHGGFWFAGDGEGTPGLEDDFGSDSDDEGSSDLEDDDEDDDDRASVGDITGIDPADDEEVYVTQPALDDVDDDFFPCLEDRDDDHLASHSLGYIHASSGIRRVVTGTHKHEIDWALIKIRDERLAISNTIQHHLTNSKRRRKANGKPIPAPSPPQNPSITHLTTIAPASTLPRLPVHCHGRTSGLRSGRISPALALVKLHGRTSFSSSWVVEGGGFGVPGDSGAWIYDPQTGRLCGHVLAWGRQSRTAYMAPMELLFEDIRRRLGADSVELPGWENAAQASRQLESLEVDLLKDGIRGICVTGKGSGTVDDADVDMDGDDDGEEARRTDTTKPIEIALGGLKIGDTLCPTGKDVPNSLTCQAQGRHQQGLQKVLRERVLGSRVA